MQVNIDKIYTHCLKSVQLLLICTCAASVYAGPQKENILKKFNPQHRIQDRSPQSFAVDVDHITAPERREIWLENILVEDEAGVLSSVKRDLSAWEKQEEYIRNWDLESTGLYTVTTQETKKNYLGKKMIKYLDKRLMGEVKKAEKGSALASVGKAQKALRHESKVSISQNFKLKFKARLLQGRAIMRVINPFVDYTTTYSFSSGLNMNMTKEIKSFRAIASVNYSANNKSYTTNIDKNLTDTIKARISSSQGQSTMFFSDESDSRFQLMYSRPFNF